jgi:tetratricopeptide (TPR) repeat protein
LLLTDGRTEEAIAEFRELLTRNADSRTWERAGTQLVRAGQYALGKEFLQRVGAGSPAARLDLAIATFFADGPDEALKVIGEAPEAALAGDYLLMKARILDAAKRRAQADEALQEGLRHSISRPQVAKEAALMLLHRDRKKEALEMIARALQSTPDDADLLLTKAIAVGLMGQIAGAEKVLAEIESRWPEWDRAYLVHGLLLERARPREAKQKLQTAISLGSGELAAQCAVARIAGSGSRDPNCACMAGLHDWLFPSCGN